MNSSLVLLQHVKHWRGIAADITQMKSDVVAVYLDKQVVKGNTNLVFPDCSVGCTPEGKH